MPSLPYSSLPAFAALILVFQPSYVVGQGAPLRAERVEEDLLPDAGTDFFIRGKNVYDSAQAAVDLQSRQQLYIRTAEIFEDYIKEFPSHPNAEAARWYLGSSYYQAGQIDTAKRTFATLMNRHPNGKYAAAAAYTVAADHYNKREYAFAAPLFERFAQNAARAGDRPKGNLFAANCYRLLGRDREAIAAYKRVVEDPAGGAFRDQASLAIGKLTMKAGKLQEALEVFEDLANRKAPAKYRGEGALQAAIIATKLDRTDVALRYLQFIMATPGMDEFRPDAQTALMENYYKSGDFAKVLEIFKQSSTKAEGEQEALRLLIAARAMMKLNQPTRAMELFREVERLVKPDNELAFQAAFYRLNCFFQVEGRHVVDQVDAFLEIYGKQHKNDTRIHTVRLMKAETLFAEGNIEEAAKTYSKIDSSLLYEANRPGFLYQRGWCLAEAGDHQGAIRSLTAFITGYPDDERIYPALVKRGKSYVEVGESARAIVDFDKLTTDKKAPSDLASLAWLESARTQRKDGNIENMLVRYRALIVNVADLTDNLKAEANYWIGWGLVKTDKPKEALTFLEKARELRPKAYQKHAGLLMILAYFAEQNPKELAAEIKQAIQQGYVTDVPDQALQWSGMQSFNAGNFEVAAQSLATIANESEPRTTPKEVWRYLGKAQLEIGEPKAALTAIKNVLEVEDAPMWKADSQLDRARAHVMLEDFKAAREAANQASDLRPQGRTAAGLRIVSGDLYRSEKEFGRAAADYLSVIQFQEDEVLKPLAIYNYSQVLAEQGKTKESEKYAAQLKTEFPDWTPPTKVKKD